MIPAIQTEMVAAQPTASDDVSRDVLRAVAHEIRQPLSTIESIAYYLSLVLPRDDNRNREQLARIQQLVEQSNWILSNGLQLSEPAPASPRPVDIEEMITRTILARASTPGPPVELALAGNLPPVQLDPGLARALVENILALFYQLATVEHPMNVRTARAASGIEIDVRAAAPQNRSRSALPPGSSLSFDCARRIAEMHGGSCTFEIDAASGIQLRVMLP